MECQLTQTIGISYTGLWVLLILGIYGLIELSNRIIQLNNKYKENKNGRRKRICGRNV